MIECTCKEFPNRWKDESHCENCPYAIVESWQR